jgi:hypothetical protein
MQALIMGGLFIGLGITLVVGFFRVARDLQVRVDRPPLLQPDED